MTIQVRHMESCRVQEIIIEKFTLPIGKRGFLQLNLSSSDFKLGTYMCIRDGLITTNMMIKLFIKAKE